MVKNSSASTLEDLYSKLEQGEVKDLNIIIKADVQGSVEAVKQSLEKLSNAEVRVRTIHSGVGAITENDVMLAASTVRSSSASMSVRMRRRARPQTATASISVITA